MVVLLKRWYYRRFFRSVSDEELVRAETKYARPTPFQLNWMERGHDFQLRYALFFEELARRGEQLIKLKKSKALKQQL